MSLTRLESLEKRKERFESQIIRLEKMSNECNKQIEGESEFDKISNLNTRIDSYSEKIDDLYDKLDDIEQQIEELKLKNQDLTLNNYLDNPKNQQELKIDDSLCNIDFQKALDDFNELQCQFNKRGDVALFFIEESSIKRGDLFLKRLKDNLKPKTSYRNHFRYCSISYTLGNLEAVIQGLATFLEIKESDVTIDLIVEKIGNSLQRNSVILIEIDCDINYEKDVDPLIPWLVDKFWKPLSDEIQEIAKKKKYTGIKIVGVISSSLKIKERFLTQSLSCYHNQDVSYFKRDKLLKIPLENWTRDEIREWLFEYSHPDFTEELIEQRAYRIFNESLEGVPRLVCDTLQQQWTTLTHPPNSC